jgi:hypothetical protein
MSISYILVRSEITSLRRHDILKAISWGFMTAGVNFHEAEIKAHAMIGCSKVPW